MTETKNSPTNTSGSETQREEEAKRTSRKSKLEAKPYVSPYYSYDDDSDGVPNGRDKCPNTPKGEKVTPFGCPYDTDFDGLYDYEDKCVNEPGPKENFGCPWGDKDNDGVKDNIDKCPDTPGPLRFAGCPAPKRKDTDGDQVYDDEDICPEIPGVIANRGCPEIKAEEKAALKNQPKEESWLDNPMVKSAGRTAATMLTRSLLGVLGLGGSTRRRRSKSLF